MPVAIDEDFWASAMFSFHGRIARFPYFLGCLGLAGACFIPLILTLGLLSPVRAGNKAALVLLIGLLIACAVTIIWISLALQTRRIRDIGWNPLIVLPAWFAFQLADPVFAHFFPAFAIGRDHSHTTFGVVVNLILTGALIFWPSAEDDGFSPAPRRAGFNPPARALDTPQVRTAQAPLSAPRATFGRR
jgi:uncharacterized membrane protein YhaH (DUF805 family)